MEIWRVVSERRDASPFPAFLALFQSEAIDINKVLGCRLNLESMVEFSNRHVRMAGILSECEKAGVLTVKKLETFGFLNWVEDGLLSEAKNLNRLGDELRQLNYAVCSNPDLAAAILQTLSTLRNFCIYNNMVNASDFYPNTLTQTILTILKYKLPDYSTTGPESAYCVLTTPCKLVWIQEEEMDILAIAKSIQSDAQLVQLILETPDSMPTTAAFRSTRTRLTAHAKKYFWMHYEQEGHTLTEDYFYCKIREHLINDIDVNLHVTTLAQKRTAVAAKAVEILDILKLNEMEQRLVESAKSFVYWKLHLREIKIRYYCCLGPLIDTIALRLGLTTTQVRHMTGEEIVSRLCGASVPSISELETRIEYSVFRFSEKGVSVLVGEEARSAFSVVTVDSAPRGTTEVLGTCANPGKAEGLVRQVLTTQDVQHFRQGEVLVAYMTDISVVPAMRKAAAIVTDVGGVTCHAAIVAREMGIPAVIGTKFGTKVLQDGHKVSVDAERGTVTILNSSSGEQTRQDSILSDTSVFKETMVLPTLRKVRSTSPIVLSFASPDCRDSGLAGGKGASLATLTFHNFPVPAGVVITSDAYLRFLEHQGLRYQVEELLAHIRCEDSLSIASSAIRQLIEQSPMPEEILQEVLAGFAEINSNTVAIRSSASAEDSMASSWAGQFDTFLDVKKEDIVFFVKKCWGSLFGERAMLYCLHRGMASVPLTMGVVIQKMVPATFAGTAFSIHPVSKADQIFIESCAGYGESVVNGSVVPASHVIDKWDLKVLKSTVGTLFRKRLGCTKSDDATIAETFETLSESEASRVAALVHSIEKRYGHPVDVEWAISKGEPYILQARPITTGL